MLSLIRESCLILRIKFYYCLNEEMSLQKLLSQPLFSSLIGFSLRYQKQ